MTDTVLRLAAIDNIVGIKEATVISNAFARWSLAPTELLNFSGEDWLCCESMLGGTVLFP